MEEKNIEWLSSKTGISVKELHRLDKSDWYHGTNIEDAYNIKHRGVVANYNLGNQLDFGPGFYLTDTEARAVSYISKLPVINNQGQLMKRENWAVVKVSFNPCEWWFNHFDECNCYNLPKYNEEFAKFVFDNRLNNVYNEKPHGYDIIWGVMSDSIPPQIILDYKNDRIDYNEAVVRFQKSTSMRQLFIGNQDICNKIVISDIIIEKEEYA